MNDHPRKFWASLAGQFGPLFALVIVFFFFAVIDSLQSGGGQFLSLRNLQAMLISSAPVVIAGLGMTIVFISGGTDLPVGTAVALCATGLAGVLKIERP